MKTYQMFLGEYLDGSWPSRGIYFHLDEMSPFVSSAIFVGVHSVEPALPCQS
jgi:hypothetical protein